MSPRPYDETTHRSAGRHAAGAEARTYYTSAPTQPSSGRHRRPESLADRTELRPAALPPRQHRRSAEDRFDLGEYQDSFIERGFPEPGLPEQRRSEARIPEQRRPEQRRTDQRRPDLGRSEQRRPELGVPEQRRPELRTPEPLPRVQRGAEAGWAGEAGWAAGAVSGEPRWSRRAQARQRAQERRAERELARQRDAELALRDGISPHRPGSGGRGKHAAPPELVVTVRALPAVRDAVAESLPTAKRAADAVREWALYTGDKPPATGTHRAPGTLPIESWLLVGRGRQQVLLASLVAAGLALVMIPIQRYESVHPVNAADRSTVSTSAAQKARTKSPTGKTAKQNSSQAQGKPATAPAAPGSKASQSAPVKPPTASAGAEPTVAVPPGTGPAQSLKVTGSQAVALTFDDGPDPVQTPKILAMLEKYQIKATFCLVGTQVEKHPEIVRQIVAAGHTLCNHTWNHSLTIGKDSTAQIRADLDRTNAAIRAAVPGAQIPFFRAPGGNFTDRLVQVAYSEQMSSLYWQVDPRDWDHSTDTDDTTHTDRVIAAVQKYVKPGSIILSHDFNQPDTIEAYETLLPWLTENFEIGVAVPPPVPVAVSPTEEQPPSEPPPSVAPSE